MEKLIDKSVSSQRRFRTFKSTGLLLALLLLTFGCRKEIINDDKQYGTGKLTVQCGGKCHVSYTVADVVNNADVDQSTGTYSIKYERNYVYKIDVTPVDVDQSIAINVYSRENKQIYHNEADKKVGEVWSAQILVP